MVLDVSIEQSTVFEVQKMYSPVQFLECCRPRHTATSTPTEYPCMIGPWRLKPLETESSGVLEEECSEKTKSLEMWRYLTNRDEEEAVSRKLEKQISTSLSPKVSRHSKGEATGS